MSTTTTTIVTSFQETKEEIRKVGEQIRDHGKKAKDVAMEKASAVSETAAKHKKILMWVLISGAIFVGAIIVIVLFWWVFRGMKDRLTPTPPPPPPVSSGKWFNF